MKTIRVLQLGSDDFRKCMRVWPLVKWYYEPDFSGLPEEDFDIAVLDREVTEKEAAYLLRFLRAYCLYITEGVALRRGGATRVLFTRKMGKKISGKELEVLLEKGLQDFFSGSYGEKYDHQNLALAQGYRGTVSWRGYEGVDLDGDYGEELGQILFWRNNIPIEGNQAIEFWLEYAKEDTVEIALEIRILCLGYGAEAQLQDVRVFSEEELKDVVYVERSGEKRGYLFASLRAKGKGRLTVTTLHDRYSRRGKGTFLPGGRRFATSDREEVFSYFDPGNLRPPLNVYFSGYKTREGFEGYRMMRELGHPFLLIAEARLEGGGFYLGSEEYEDTIEAVIREYMRKLGFGGSEVILSGLSMGTFGAMYYGCRIHPNTILVGKPLLSIGDVAWNERLGRPGGFPTSLDVLHKLCGSLDQAAVQKLNNRFWDVFDHTDWSGTRFATAYMIEDDYDRTAYEKLQSHLMNADVRIYGKGLHGRHNDDTSGIVSWFVGQYREIIQRDFDGRRTGGEDER